MMENIFEAGASFTAEVLVCRGQSSPVRCSAQVCLEHLSMIASASSIYDGKYQCGVDWH
jgi:hypothetical protein